MIRQTLALLVPLVAVTTLTAHDASACGGCFVPPDANTQVTGHRMVLSVSGTETTLWDQIEYSGSPESFAWVLPTKGLVDVGISSDLLFNTLAFLTDPQIIPPYLDCPYSCGYDEAGDGAVGSSGAGAASGGDGVQVIAEEVVGPYQTVQLSADEPAALQNWLATNGYNLPDDVAPIVEDYVNEGFNFLALKLVPGQGVDAMKPVRITTPGASPVLPLRMVAAGTGAITPITLWMIGEGRYQPANFGQFSIGQDQVIWNWDTSDSNYATLKEAGFTESGGAAWLIESALPQSPYAVANVIQQVVDFQPEQSGYGSPDGTPAEEAAADLEALYGSVDRPSMWITRMHGQLPRAALGTDLLVEASMDQAEVSHVYQVTKTTGKVPECPPDPCASGSSGGEWPFGDGWSGGDSGFQSDSGCAFGHNGGLSALGALSLAMMIALARRRRSR
jgi:hypothetical protein